MGKRLDTVLSHRCTLYQPTDPVTAAGPGDRTYASVATGVACYFVPKSAVDITSIAGLQESEDMQTVDELHVALSRTIEHDWVVVNTSTDRNGAHVPDWGEAAIVRGSPRSVVGAGGRNSDYRVAYISRLAKKPTGVT